MRRKRCGNAGAVESVESQRQASPSFHEPLGKLAKGGRASHIPTAPATRADGKVENQKQVFRFPTAPRIDWERINKKPRRAVFALCPPKPTKHHERRLLPATWTTPFSGSCRIGIEESFQAHLPLESILDFRLICGLENAVGPVARSFLHRSFLRRSPVPSGALALSTSGNGQARKRHRRQDRRRYQALAATGSLRGRRRG
jgi:hypothetical protein